MEGKHDNDGSNNYLGLTSRRGNRASKTPYSERAVVPAQGFERNAETAYRVRGGTGPLLEEACLTFQHRFQSNLGISRGLNDIIFCDRKTTPAPRRLRDAAKVRFANDMEDLEDQQKAPQDKETDNRQRIQRRRRYTIYRNSRLPKKILAANG